MKYALISDIHANLPAPEAVLADIDREAEVDAIYHLGDLVGYTPWPNEVVALIRERGTQGIAGNYDSTTATDYPHCGCKADSPRGEELSPLLRVDEGACLPRDQAHSRGAALQDGPETPGRTQERSDADPRARHSHAKHPLLDGGSPRLLRLQDGEGCGGQGGGSDRLRPHSQALASGGGGRTLTQHWVGKPKDGDWRAGYALVEADEDIVRVEFVRVEYDLERAVEGILGSELSDEFADQLKADGTPKPLEVA